MINTDLSVQKRWVARRGYNNPFTLTITSSGSAYNVSSYVFVCNIRKIGASTNLLQLTEGLGITNGGATGVVTVQLSAANSTTLNEGSYYYEMYYTVGGLSYGLLHGTLDLVVQFNGENVDDSISISVNLAGTDVNIAVTLASAGSLITTNRQTDDYILVLTDADKLIEMNKATANTLTVPPNSSVAFPIGTAILVTQYGAGATTIQAGSGVTIRSAAGALALSAQYAGASLIKIATNEWYLNGSIA